jgi:hypothetical protein
VALGPALLHATLLPAYHVVLQTEFSFLHALHASLELAVLTHICVLLFCMPGCECIAPVPCHAVPFARLVWLAPGHVPHKRCRLLQ